jgi:hypothetical protein
MCIFHHGIDGYGELAFAIAALEQTGTGGPAPKAVESA